MGSTSHDDPFGGWTPYRDVSGKCPALDAFGDLKDRRLQLRLTQVLARHFRALEEGGWQALRLDSARQGGNTYFLVDARVGTTNVCAAVVPIHGVPVVLDVFRSQSGPDFTRLKGRHLSMMKDLYARPEALAGIPRIAEPPEQRGVPQHQPGQSPRLATTPPLRRARGFEPVPGIDHNLVEHAIVLLQSVHAAHDRGVEPPAHVVRDLDEARVEIGRALLDSGDCPPAIRRPLGPEARAAIKRTGRANDMPARLAGEIYLIHAMEDIPLDGPAYGSAERYPEGRPREIYEARMATLASAFGRGGAAPLVRAM